MLEKVPFVYTNDITAVNKEQFDVHIRLYQGYIDYMNQIDATLETDPQRGFANPVFSFYRECKRGETFALNGVILHELYFQNMGGIHRQPSEAVMAALAKDFGDFTAWRTDFIATGKASRGWAVLAFDQRSNRYRNISLDAHDLGNIAYSAPVLIMDVYEHAYFLQYADKKGEYINKFMDNINWSVVQERMDC